MYIRAHIFLLASGSKLVGFCTPIQKIVAVLSIHFTCSLFLIPFGSIEQHSEITLILFQVLLSWADPTQGPFRKKWEEAGVSRGLEEGPVLLGLRLLRWGFTQLVQVFEMGKTRLLCDSHKLEATANCHCGSSTDGNRKNIFLLLLFSFPWAPEQRIEGWIWSWETIA